MGLSRTRGVWAIFHNFLHSGFWLNFFVLLGIPNAATANAATLIRGKSILETKEITLPPLRSSPHAKYFFERARVLQHMNAELPGPQPATSASGIIWGVVDITGMRCSFPRLAA